MKQYHYVDANNQAAGPVSPNEFAQYGITTDTYVFCEGMTAWEKAGKIPELAAFFAQPIPPCPTMPPPPTEEPELEEEELDANYYARPSRHLGKIIFGMIASTLSILYFISFIVTIPLGILGIVFGSKAVSAFDNEDYVAAKKYRKMSTGFAIPVMIIGIISLIADLFFIGILIAES